MDFNRNQWFMIGLVVVLLGVQFRLVDTYILNDSASRFIAERFWQSTEGANGTVQSIMPTAGTTTHKSVKPPDWIGWASISLGSVLMLHALAMKKPGG